MTKREIKFRQRVDNQFHYWGFINGKFISPVGSSSGENYTNTKSDQYTGLKDKNGKEIWEGDILQIKDVCVDYDDFDNEILRDKKMVVEFIDGGFVALMKSNYLFELSRTRLERFETEVIGNIYENKELLK